MWNSGFLSGKHTRVALRSTGDPVLYLENPDGVSSGARRTMLDVLAKLNQHSVLPKEIRAHVGDTDQSVAALVKDLKQRGLLDSTLVVWGGEFGRTVYSQGKLTADNYGRDHHPKCFTMFMAGGGVKGGISYEETDDFSYNVVENPVHPSYLNATILHCMGIHHDHFTFKFQGLDQRLTGAEPSKVVKAILA